MSLKKMYYPQDRVLEDYEDDSQTLFGFDLSDDERFDLIEPNVATILVTERVDGEIEKVTRKVSLYKITLGNRQPFIAGIIANHEVNINASAYRLLNNTEGVIDYIYE